VTFEGFLAASFGAFVLSGKPTIDLDTEVAACGHFALSGEGAFLSYDLLGGGGAIVAGTFSRGRWRDLQEQLAAEQAIERKAVAANRRRRREQAEAAARAERERAWAARAEVDQANAAAAGERALADALAVSAGVQRAQDLMRHTVALHALAAAAQASAHAKTRADAIDEEEAIALLLAA